jgi:O-antigen/teichoic acid export membrane protein
MKVHPKGCHIFKFWSLARDKIIQSRFARNWSFLVVANLGGQALGMLATIRIARMLLPGGYGQYTLVLTIMGIGVVFTGLGLRNVIIRECARHPEQSTSYFFVAALLRSIIFVIVGAGIIIYTQFSHQGLSLAFSAATVGLVMAWTGWDLAESIAFGYERMQYSAVITLSGSLLWVAAVWLAPRVWFTPLNVSFVQALLQLGETAVYGVIGWRRIHSFPTLQQIPWREKSRELLGQGFPFYWLALLTMGVNQIPILFLAGRSGNAEVGLYNASYRLIAPPQMILLAALTALYPKLSRDSADDKEQFLFVNKRALLLITLFGTAFAVGIGLMRQEIILLIYGTTYRLAANALYYQAWYTVLLVIYSLIGTTLAANDQQKTLSALSTIYAFVSVPILWWGAGYGAIGLAMAMLGAVIINLPYHWFYYQRNLSQRIGKGLTLKLVAILGGGMVITWAIPQTIDVIWRLIFSTSLAVLISIFSFSEIKNETARVGNSHMQKTGQ